MHPKDLSIAAFTYELTEDKIALYPLAGRDQSKLLIYDEQGNISASHYRQLPDILPADSVLVFNNTKVVEARLLFKKDTGSIIELFCLQDCRTF